MSHRSLFSGLSTLAIAGLFALPSAAIVPSDDPNTNYSTIQAAVNDNAGGTVVLSPGTYKINHEIVISNGASLVGGGASRNDVIIDVSIASTNDLVDYIFDGAHSAIVISNSTTTVVSNLTITASNTKNGSTKVYHYHPIAA